MAVGLRLARDGGNPDLQRRDQAFGHQRRGRLLTLEPHDHEPRTDGATERLGGKGIRVFEQLTRVVEVVAEQPMGEIAPWPRARRARHEEAGRRVEVDPVRRGELDRKGRPGEGARRYAVGPGERTGERGE